MSHIYPDGHIGPIFEQDHPEREEDEVYIGNMDEWNFREVSFVSARKGTRTFDRHGGEFQEEGTFPVFVLLSEFLIRRPELKDTLPKLLSEHREMSIPVSVQVDPNWPLAVETSICYACTSSIAKLEPDIELPEGVNVIICKACHSRHEAGSRTFDELYAFRTEREEDV